MKGSPGSPEWLRVTLSSIGDAVITTDLNGNITFLNPTAESLTGWSAQHAIGVPLERVFRIINQATRAVVESPTVRALREGVTVGLANHTLLIAKDGSERPIDDSAAPIRSADGAVCGAVLVFRDIAERYRQEKLIQEALSYAETILGTLREPFLVLDAFLTVISANRSFYTRFQVTAEETEGRFLYELGNGQWNIPPLRQLLEEVLPDGQALEGFEVEHDFSSIGRKVMLLNARRVPKPGSQSELILLAIEDITDRKRDQSLLASQKAVIEQAASGAPLEEMLALLVRAVQEHAGQSARAAMFIVEGDCLRFAVSAGMSAAYTTAVDRFAIGPDSPSCGTAAFSGQTVIVGDVWKDPLWQPCRQLADEHQIRACWSHPMATPGGQVLGTLALYHRTPREPGPGDLDAMRLLSQTAAILIVRQQETQKRRVVEEALGSSEVRYRRLFQTAKDGIIILDAQTGKIIDANAFMSGLLGQELPDLLGKELFQIGLFSDVTANKQVFNQLKQDGYVRYEHLPVQNRNGDTTHVEFISNVYREGDRLVAQCNVRDISARVVMELKIKQQAEALADQSRHKDEFLAMLSHELRNPLAPIRSATHLLRLQERGSENLIQQQAREVIERQVTTLTRLVSDLMEVSRALTGRIRLDLQVVDMNQLVRHALETAAPLIESRAHKLTVDLCPGPIWARVDATRMEEVFVNLLANAAKYTDKGGSIMVACEHHQNHVLVRIRDTGAGIEPALLPRIFDLFTQADRTLDRAQGGLGIGLALAHRLVELHGGSIEAHSEGPGTGSEFIVRIQLVSAPGVLPSPPTAHESSAPNGLRILVVDDNIDACLMLANLVRLRGYGVQTAHSGPAAVSSGQAWRPDVVLLDIGLPGIDGYEVARRLRADPLTKATKLIAVTGYGAEQDIALGREAGFDAHLVKPVDLADIENLLARWKLSSSTTPAPGSLPAVEPPAEIVKL